jgi:hypothetical protein
VTQVRRDIPWYELSSKHCTPVTLRRKAGYLANHLDKLADGRKNVFPAHDSARVLQQYCRFALARRKPNSEDGKFLRRRYARRKTRPARLTVLLLLRLVPLVQTAVHLLERENTSPDVLRNMAADLRKVAM